MTTLQQTANQQIYNNITQLQADLEKTLKKIFEQAGSKIEPDRGAEVTQELEGTQKRLELFKSKYA